ncbi:winged helix-turn-helix domain-containing protein [Rhodopseudomonas sp. RCAM05734]|uniref:winged helix-turn-helix domain-containing protein n=1 Tax=Rhodopseudomonas sp. RCAM05734 TaxID=3457549 RepID=UPI004044F3EB
MVLCFSGFELDRERAELRGPDGVAIKLRPKTCAMLSLFAANAGQVLSKQDLIEAVWPNVHVGDDSLFQCIKEIRTAIGDDRRQMIRLVSGRGYVFEADVLAGEPATPEPAAAEPAAVLPTILPEVPPADQGRPAEPSAIPRVARKSNWRHAAFAVAGLGAIAALAILAIRLTPDLVPARGAPVIAVMPIAAADDDSGAMAANVTTRLADGLAKIENIRVAVPQSGSQAGSGQGADFIVNAELRKTERSWEVRARMTRAATREVVWTAPVSVSADETELSQQQSRLAAGIGHPLALRLGVLLDPAPPVATSDGGSPPGSARVVIEQATASIVQTSRERFETAQTMLEKALAGDPDNSDLAVALAALQMRGVQMVWYNPEERAAAEHRAREVLERALRNKPNSIPVLEAYCRFLNATNEFVESLVACARTLNFDPWNGVGLYHIGLAQMQLGRFDDALASFQQADRFDTPQVSRWTWRLGIGMIYVLTQRGEDALPWLQSSIAITPASGRPYMVLAAAYLQLGRAAEAKTAMDKAIELRPGSNLANVTLPSKNASAAFLAAGDALGRAFVAAGLPEH